MTNETMIEALEYGLIMVIEKNYNNTFYLSCSHMVCNDCKFKDLIICDFDLTKENFNYLEENYPEHLLKV